MSFPKSKGKFSGICKEIAGNFRIPGNCRLQRLQRLEALLRPQKPQKFQCDNLTVEISVKIQEPGFRADLVALHRGTAAHIADGHVALLPHKGVAGVNAVPGDDHIPGQLDVRRGKAQAMAQLPSTCFMRAVRWYIRLASLYSSSV